MKIKYSWLQSYFKDKLPTPKDLADILTMHSLEVESVEKKESDYIFDVAVLPNRAFDYIDHLGVIRDISAILKIEANVPTPSYDRRRTVSFKFSDIEKILGVNIPEKEVIDILTRLDMEIKKEGETMAVKIPDFRPDIELKEDVIEEIAIIYGYEKIEPKTPEGLLISPKKNDNFFYAGIVRRILTGLGFDEVYNYSFAGKGEFELENPIAEGREFLRANLLNGLSENVKNNSRYFEDIKIFEIGKIFPRGGEIISLAGVINKGKFYEIKGVVDVILKSIGVSDFYYEESAEKVAEIRIGNSSLGAIDRDGFELNFEELVKLANESAEYKPISKYPAVMRDLALFVLPGVKVMEVTDVIENTAGELLADSDLFDIYENADRKSLAFRLIFQSHDKTLTDEEVNDVMNKIFKALEANLGWEVRK